MGLLHFPSALTEEEEILKQTFARLKKKKKALHSLKVAALQQEKEASHSKLVNNKPTPPPAIDSADKATEQAKKLVQSGAIKVTSMKEKSGFKRSKTLERKKDTDKPPPGVGFQPFMSYNADDDDDKPPVAKRIKGLNETFVPSGFTKSYDRPEREHREPPKKGNTVYVYGVGISEDLIQKSFSNFGKIINISMETERNKAFVTFDTMEAADQAIAGVNGSMINNTQLRVQLARRQPSFDAVNDATSTASWSSIAASNSQKGNSHKDKRGMVQYDHDDMF